MNGTKPEDEPMEFNLVEPLLTGEALARHLNWLVFKYRVLNPLAQRLQATARADAEQVDTPHVIGSDKSWSATRASPEGATGNSQG